MPMEWQYLAEDDEICSNLEICQSAAVNSAHAKALSICSAKDLATFSGR